MQYINLRSTILLKDQVLEISIEPKKQKSNAAFFVPTFCDSFTFEKV